MVYDDAGVVGRSRLDLGELPRDAEVLDVMGNDPRREGEREWEVGIQPLSVVSDDLPADELTTIPQQAVGDQTSADPPARRDRGLVTIP